ncbi:MAG: proprotein convertase P-domain-containing protein [Kribbellaceae bacterium]
MSSFASAIAAAAQSLGGGGGTPACGPFTNATNVNIPDVGSAVTSPVAAAGCTENASTASKVEVHIKHTYRGDLVIDLVAPDGTAYRLKNSSGSDSADNVDATYTVDASSEVRNGSWKLQVRDVYSADTGYIDSWSLSL